MNVLESIKRKTSSGARKELDLLLCCYFYTVVLIVGLIARMLLQRGRKAEDGNSSG